MKWVPTMRIEVLPRMNEVPVTMRRNEVDSQHFPVTGRSLAVLMCWCSAIARLVPVDTNDVPMRMQGHATLGTSIPTTKRSRELIGRKLPIVRTDILRMRT